jgi:hypothetical protein
MKNVLQISETFLNILVFFAKFKKTRVSARDYTVFLIEVSVDMSEGNQL